MSEFKKPEPMKKRYVLYSDGLGIYLGMDAAGACAWSIAAPCGVVQAPTFELDNPIKEDLTSYEPRLKDELRFIEVWPSNSTFATVDDCANAGLPRWQPDN